MGFGWKQIIIIIIIRITNTNLDDFNSCSDHYVGAANKNLDENNTCSDGR